MYTFQYEYCDKRGTVRTKTRVFKTFGGANKFWERMYDDPRCFELQAYHPDGSDGAFFTRYEIIQGDINVACVYGWDGEERDKHGFIPLKYLKNGTFKWGTVTTKVVMEVRRNEHKTVTETVDYLWVQSLGWTQDYKFVQNAQAYIQTGG